MDPSPRPRRSRTSWFPRPRGDGPRTDARASILTLVSPPTRGWTQALRSEHPPRAGFPAHAGMDLLASRSSEGLSGFPRPRGDGPSSRIPTSKRRGVSPPTRGWTRVSDGLKVASDGFPAHAGMDPRAGERPRTQARFPRPRGDGPPPATAACLMPPVSPPTRGWTQAPLPDARRAEGFPAHAGMGPFPQTPLHAFTTVSPPTRGWTPARRIPALPRLGFPAHAGMDPRR